MFKKILISAFLVSAMIGCGNGNKGMVADEPSIVLVELFKQYENNNDFMTLCSNRLNESDVRKALKDWKSCGGYYVITDGGKNTYMEITGKKLSLATNETVFSFIGAKDKVGEFLLGMQGKGYVIISQDNKSKKYTIKDIRFKL